MTKLSDEDIDEIGAWMDEAERRFQHDRMVPDRLKAIRQWVETIRANPGDIRATAHEQPKEGGGTFVSMVTDLDSILAHANAVERKFQRGDYLLARTSLEELNDKVHRSNARLTEPFLASGQESHRGAIKGGKATSKRERDMDLARQFVAKRDATSPAVSSDKLKCQIGRAEGLKDDAARKAIRRGMFALADK